MCCFFFNDTATTEIYTLSLHDALPICEDLSGCDAGRACACLWAIASRAERSEEHTSELQSLAYLVCRLLLEKNNAPEIRLSPRAPAHRRIDTDLAPPR